jgi:hypothetical protein
MLRVSDACCEANAVSNRSVRKREYSLSWRSGFLQGEVAKFGRAARLAPEGQRWRADLEQDQRAVAGMGSLPDEIWFFVFSELRLAGPQETAAAVACAAQLSSATCDLGSQGRHEIPANRIPIGVPERCTMIGTLVELLNRYFL